MTAESWVERYTTVLSELGAAAERLPLTLAPHSPSKPPHGIFEVTAGERVGPIVAQRSTRIIVRFFDEHLDRDPGFARESIRLADRATSAVICGSNELADLYLDQELTNTCHLLSEWRRRGISLIHLELGGYENKVVRDQVFSTLGPFIKSLGMSHSELREFGPEDESNRQASCARGSIWIGFVFTPTNGR
jgi:ADP-dependent phosphofructokinase/glucokinase